jgi:hypothetical protein
MLKAGIGTTEDTLRESDAAPGGRAETRREPRRRDRAVQRQQRQSSAAPQLHRHPAHQRNKCDSSQI